MVPTHTPPRQRALASSPGFDAQGSGRPLQEVMILFQEHKRMGHMWGKMGKLKLQGKGGLGSHSNRQNLQQMSKVIPPQLLNQMGGMGALQQMMKQFEKGGLPPGMGGLM